MRRWIAFPLSAVVAVAVGAVLFGTTSIRTEAGVNPFTFAVDCNPGTLAVEASCGVAVGSRTVNLVITNNSGADNDINSFEFDLVAQPQPDLNPTAIPVISATISGTGTWNCSLSPSAQDSDPSPSVARSELGCFQTAGPSVPLPDGATLVLASLTYTATANGSSIAIENTLAGNEGGIELGSCNPDITNVATCVGASFGTAPPTATFTPTNTPTNTNTPTGGTATPCPNGICPTSTPLDFATVTPTPCDPNCPEDTATPGTGGTPPPGGETPPTGGTPPPSGSPGSGSGTPGTGVITPPDTGDGTGDGGYNWASIAVMTLIALGAGGLAGGGYLLASSRTGKD